MLDENLPTFFVQPSRDDGGRHSNVYLSQNGEDFDPTYSLRRPDPELASSKNCYAVALFDSYNPQVVYGEVTVRPEWTETPLSAADLRRGETIPPPPTAIIPTDFVIQLYAPDQQVYVRHKAGSWGASAHWEFDLPQTTFRQPSGSSLDRSQNDPAASETTPKLTFKWKKEGKLSKDMVCMLSGMSHELDGKKKIGSREPDITVALFHHLKSVTMYQPNIDRVELEDRKGLEVVLILSAIVIKDLTHGNPREHFNLTSGPNRLGSGDSGRISSPTPAGVTFAPPLPPRGRASSVAAAQGPGNAAVNGQPANSGPRPPPADPMTQWQIDSETRQLKAQAEAEERAAKHAEREERRRIKRMLEAEAKEEKRRKEEVDRETERLRILYLDEQMEAEKRLRTSNRLSPQPQNQRPSSLPPAPRPAQGFPSPQQPPYGAPQQAPYATPQQAPYAAPPPQPMQPFQYGPPPPFQYGPGPGGPPQPYRPYGPPQPAPFQPGRPPQAGPPVVSGGLGPGPSNDHTRPRRGIFGLHVHTDPSASTQRSLNTKRSSVF
ncbi:MAG: hypothetical protein M1838_003911 [Thelocarpon superellum]|nr:MAG: hypothetical protein M1838_003911 [Thelocarpon superellum]